MKRGELAVVVEVRKSGLELRKDTEVGRELEFPADAGFAARAVVTRGCRWSWLAVTGFRPVETHNSSNYFRSDCQRSSKVIAGNCAKKFNIYLQLNQVYRFKLSTYSKNCGLIIGLIINAAKAAIMFNKRHVTPCSDVLTAAIMEISTLLYKFRAFERIVRCDDL